LNRCGKVIEASDQSIHGERIIGGNSNERHRQVEWNVGAVRLHQDFKLTYSVDALNVSGYG
jgi:hypothetical protein